MDSNQKDLGGTIARFADTRDWTPFDVANAGVRTGLGDQLLQSIIDGRANNVSRGALMKIAAAMALKALEREDLERASGMPYGSLHETLASKFKLPEISMCRGVLLLTAPTDPHLIPLESMQEDVATRTGVVFGWHDVVVRVTTPPDRSVLDYADELFETTALRTVETIPLRDDLDIYVDREFSFDEIETGDYYWAVIFIQALGTPTKLEVRDIFFDAAASYEFQGGIHLLTAAVAIGRFDSLIEVLASDLLQLQAYVRGAQKLCGDNGQEIHTVTYFALQWQQKPTMATF